MKKILYGLFTACLLTGSFTACNSKLDVEPTDSIDATNALTTSADVEAALVGCYTGLQNADAYGGNIQLLSDLLADNGEISFVGTFIPPNQAARKQILKDNGFVTSIWTNAYDVINRTNNVLANLDKLDTPAKQARVEGEAKFIRSLLYFDLVRLYARDWNDGNPQTNLGVPLVLSPTTAISGESQVRRNTVAEVYTQILTDLTTAEARLTTANPANNNGFFANRYSVAALLSRVYLQQSKFAESAAAANRVISSGRYSLTSSYAEEFTSSNDLLGNTQEDIFAIQISSQSGANELNTYYSVNRRADVNINDQLIDQFESGDERLDLILIDPDGGPAYSGKYDVLYGNIKLFRLAEMYLNRAEGNFRAGTTAGAAPLDDINTIRERAGLAPLTTLTLDDILKERRLELALEGFRLGDLKRNKESTVDLGNPPVTLPYNSPRLIFPIPLREINANPNLVQNEGY
ncbi:RagB/SusD family nutrient uptake outer membrane protein [Hymenobacter sp. HSC-4F20]|uniref:RagB/SusD family nutrient uptake outer membrane protein n=1 Tax=Hymenobacter sp. HSC-4F20 TaxID=2864135 RepID=UPI001C73B4C6|nr:RagB/SusD family nutrient uptake outer membrane protein [Hymenobacter sp. HSC-4F20]MBX0290783.1 RagB/SusD family nutrient uptake outer membrane protein [Hymenobacter sp. HSC-4F20]